MKIRRISAKPIPNSRREKTISITIYTNAGSFYASSPSGKSKGKYEKKSYKKSIEEDIKKVREMQEYFSSESFDCFNDLRRVEDIVDRHIGANTLFALQSAVLKAIAKEQKKEVWQIINPKISTKEKFPRLVGNCIGGGKHSQTLTGTGRGKGPDFQEFLLIPKTKSVKEAFEKNKREKEKLRTRLKEKDINFKERKNSENAWETDLNEKQVLEILKQTKMPLGLDVAASSFYKRKKYCYKNPLLKRDKEEQLNYISNLIKNYPLFYIEDPFDEEDFESFPKLLKKFPDRLIVGDDLIVTNSKRLEKAVKMKSVNAIIVKPNQCGSLLEVSRVCEIAKKNSIKTVFSHRSGETTENILADLAFGFQSDFLKCGIDGKEREAKLKRLIEIEKKIRG